MHFRRLTFGYSNQLIFEDLSLCLASPIISLIGPPGCGKTTLLKLIAGCLVPLSAEDFVVPTPVGLVIQEPTLLPWLTGIGNIVRIASVDREKLYSSRLFPLIEPFARKRACEMSYGQRRLIELTRMLLFVPRVMCLDEPFNFLDPVSRSTILSELTSIAGGRSQVILTAHDEREISDIQGQVFSLSGHFPMRALTSVRSE